MAVPTQTTYSIEAKVAARSSLVALLDAETGAALLRFRDATDQLLAQADFGTPCATVNSETGELVFSIPSDAAGVLAGEIAYCEVCDGSGYAHIAIPAKQGSEADPGWLVVSSSSVEVGVPVSIVEARLP